jgi:Flp pilus assembly protein TadB
MACTPFFQVLSGETCIFNYWSIFIIMLGIIIVLLVILVIELARRRNLQVSKMIVGEEIVEHETIEKDKHEDDFQKIEEPKAKYHWKEEKSEKKEEKPEKKEEKPEKKSKEKKKEKKQSEGFAKTCIEVWAIPTYVLLGLILVFFLQLLFYGTEYLYTVITISAAVIAAAVVVFFLDRHFKKTKL